MDTEGLFKSLNAHRVEFVVIGATAFPVHGYARATLDVDVFIRPTRENAERAWHALKQFGYDVTDVTVADLLKKKLLIRQYAVETDLHPFVAGVTFDEVWKRSVKTRYGRITARFASLTDLIKMKRAAGRAKDHEDLRYLLKLKTPANRRQTKG